MQKSIVIIMAHSDDIEYSAGATFAKYISQGYKALYGVLSLCNSGWSVTKEKGGHYTSSMDIIPRRKAEAKKAAEIFGAEFHQWYLLENCYTRKDGKRVVPGFKGAIGLDGKTVELDEDLPDGMLFSVAAGAGATFKDDPIISEVAELLAEWEPELVVGQPMGNYNLDHFAASQIVALAWQLAAEKADIGPYWIPVQHYIKKEGGMPPFPPLKPDKYVDVDGFEEISLKALSAHESQGGHLWKTQERFRKMWKFRGEKHKVQSAEAFLEVFNKQE